MLGPLRLPHVAARALTVNLSRALRYGGRTLTPITSRLPVGPRTVDADPPGFLFPVPDPELAAVAIASSSPPRSTGTSPALRTSRHARVSLRGIKVPAEFVAATFDVLAGARDMKTAADRVEGATYVELRGSHFIQMEQPDRVHQLLVDFTDRVSDVHRRAALAVLAALTLGGCSGTPTTAPPRTTRSPPPRTHVLQAFRETSSPSEAGSRSPSQEPSRPPGPPRVVDTIASGLAVPWGLGFLPNGDAIVTERDSRRVLRIHGPGHAVEVLGTIDAAAPLEEGGLLGVAVSPDFARDRLLFFYVTRHGQPRRPGDVRPRPARAALGRPRRDPRGFIHDGGRLAFGPDGFLYVSTGETGDPAGPGPRLARGQDPADHDRRRPAPATRSRARRSGLRPPQRAGAGVRRPGPAVGLGVRPEHLRRAQPDRGRRQLRLAPGRGPRRAGGLVDPQVVWATDVASPSGLAFLDGRLWLASLRGQRLWRIDVTGQRARDPQDFFVGTYGRMRTVAVAPDGRLG